MNNSQTRLRWVMCLSLLLYCFSCQMDEHLMQTEPNDGLLFLTGSSGPKLGNWNLLFEETFEDNPFYAYVTKQFSENHSFKVSSSPSFRGENVGRFELRKSDDKSTRTGKRAEILLEQPSHKEGWYSFAVYLPSKGFESDNDDEVLSQWHNSGTPTLSLRAVKDRFFFRIGHDANVRTALWNHYDFGAIPKNEWITFVFHIVHSDKDDGLVEVWKDGNKILKHSGPNNYRGVRLPRWKVGIYKSSWANKSTNTDTRILYYDNIRMGNERASYEEMYPGNDNDKGWGPYVHTIESFTLINSIGNKVLGTLPNNGEINIGPLNDNRITLRAEFEEGFDGSVEFELKGPKNLKVVRNQAEYTLYGYNDGNYHNGGGTPKGNYTLIVTPYEGHNKRGKKGNPVDFKFSVTERNGNEIIKQELNGQTQNDLNSIADNLDGIINSDYPSHSEPQFNMVGYWKMDESIGRDLKDDSGKGNHAVIVNHNDVSRVSGVHGLALNLNGRLNRFAAVNHNSSIDLSESVTISAWIRPVEKARKQILSKGDGYELSIFENGKVEFRINRDTNASDFRLNSKTDYPTNGSTWMHVAVTFDGRKSTMYINGVEDNAATYDFTRINTNNSPLQIGAKNGDNRWTGTLDEVRLYNKALSPSQIMDIYK